MNFSGNSISFSITALSDGVTEGDEVIQVEVFEDNTFAGFVIPFTIKDPPTPVISITGGDAVTEGGNAVFTLTAEPAPPASIAVDVRVGQTGSFVSRRDIGVHALTIGPAGTATLTVPTVDDATEEASGTVVATVQAKAGYMPHDTQASASVTVNDNDGANTAPTVANPISDQAATAGTAFSYPFPANTFADTDSDTLSYTATQGDGSALPAWLTFTARTRTFSGTPAPGDTGTLAVRVTADDGRGGRASDTFNIVVSAAAQTTPVVRIARTTASVTEGANAVFTLTASPAPASSITVNVQVSQTGSFAPGGQTGSRTVTIGTGGTATLTVTTDDDATEEANGAITAAVGAGNGYSPHDTQASASVTVNDNDGDDPPQTTPVVRFASASSSAGEAGGTRTVTVNLSPAPQSAITLAYTVGGTATAGGTAPEGSDFSIADAGRVAVPAGTTRITIPVALTDDDVSEGPETVLLTLTAGTDYTVGSPHVHTLTITDDDTAGLVLSRSTLQLAEEGATATFTHAASSAGGGYNGRTAALHVRIGQDPVAAASEWLNRFGRTLAQQTLDGIASRRAADRTPGLRAALAGQTLQATQTLQAAPALHPDPGDRPSDSDAALAALAHPFEAGHPGSAAGHTLAVRDLLTGSSFSLTGATDASGASLALWGRAAQGRFDGTGHRDGAGIRLDGTLTTGLLGADYGRDRWLLGLALSQSDARGDYAGAHAGDGRLKATLTAAIPYASLRASKRLSLWAAAGYGTGEVRMKTDTGARHKADTRWSMAAAGLRSDLPEAAGPGPALSLTSDALWTRTASKRTAELAASNAHVTRLRLGLEGRWHMTLDDGTHLQPKLEVGARHDGGDAEHGFGVELGAGVRLRDPARGLSLEAAGRTLIAHEDDDFRDRGLSAALGYDPAASSHRGPSLALR
ncbi:MAG: putative Ig domain-containing protein, partial [Gammaproteobacteria bacterium]|nr:putative Ig domain-containing protein [Gammaproteobacteria bacterium]